ncbi:MAG: hypothetical protein ACK44B_10940 [Flavobacteriales bacterium]
MVAQFQDPRGEYSKQCPYCLEYITVDHLNRDFCPEKNGIKDFCKNRYRRLKDNLKAIGVVIEKPASKPLKITISRDKTHSNKTIDDSINDSIVERNKRILESLLGSEEYFQIELNELLHEGFEIDFYDSVQDTSSGYQVHKIGLFALVFLDNDLVYITFKNKLNI